MSRPRSSQTVIVEKWPRLYASDVRALDPAAVKRGTLDLTLTLDDVAVPAEIQFVLTSQGLPHKPRAPSLVCLSRMFAACGLLIGRGAPGTLRGVCVSSMPGRAVFIRIAYGASLRMRMLPVQEGAKRSNRVEWDGKAGRVGVFYGGSRSSESFFGGR
jgi:hypothetical protein